MQDCKTLNAKVQVVLGFRPLLHVSTFSWGVNVFRMILCHSTLLYVSDGVFRREAGLTSAAGRHNFMEQNLFL